MSEALLDSSLSLDRALSRPLGRTSCSVSPLALGGGGILRTHGCWQIAETVVDRSLTCGINLFVTAPGWGASEDYLGAALTGHRTHIHIASQTHDRTRDGSLRLLEESLGRLRTNYLDIWLIQDLRTAAQVDRVFAPGGAGEALRQARDQGIVRFVGVSAKHDPTVLLSALERFEFDVVAFPINAAESDQFSFADLVLPVARTKGLGIMALEATVGGRFLDLGVLSLSESLGYPLSQPGIGTALVECVTQEEVDQHVRALDGFAPFSAPMLRMLEERSQRHRNLLTYYRRPVSCQDSLQSLETRPPTEAHH